MVDLPTVNNGIVTSRAPESAITAGVIEKTASDRAVALDKGAGVLTDVSTELAKKEAADQLINQKITRNADGSVNVENPATSPLIFGEAGQAFSDAVKVGTYAQHSNDISQHFAELHQEFPTDPAGFKTAAQAYLDKRGQQVTGVLGEAIQKQGGQLLTQHFNAITSSAASNDLENQKKSIVANIEDQKNTAIALARKNGADSPEFKQAVGQMNAAYDALAENPLFKMPREQIEREKKNTYAFLQGEAIVAHVDETFNKRGKADAQKVLNEAILQNPNLREVDRTRLYTQGMARLGYLTADAKATIDANRQITTGLEEGLAKGTVAPEDPAVAQAIKRAQEIGDTEGAQRITAAAAVKQQLRGVNILPDAIRNEVLGMPGGAINKTLPPEARGLLDTIAKTESAGRYNVRYGEKTFQEFGDHPRVAEPITSGPDVGKTSTAAGRYQFLASTWDAQRAKLGLKDFSPENQDLAAWDLAQTEYKARTGKDLLTTLKSGDTSDVLPALSGQWSSLPGGRQPAKQFGGFTPDQVAQNPFLISAYVRTLAHDPELRVQSAKQTAAAVGKALDNGILPSPAAIAEVNQAARMYPEKMGTVADEMNGRLVGQKIAQLPQEQRDQVEEAYRQAAGGQDVHTMNVAAAALKQVQDSAKNMADHPYDEAAQRGWTQPATPIDPAQPGGIPAALAQRATLSKRIGDLNHTPPPPLLDKDEMPKLQTALQGPDGAAVLSGIATALKAEEMHSLLGQKGFTDSLVAMQSSMDPAKMSVANAAVERIWQQNPALASQALGGASLDKLQSWQALKGSFSAEELAKRLNAADDPATAKARKEAREAAATEVEKLSAGDVAYKMGSGSWLFGRLTGNTPGVPIDVQDNPNLPGGSLMSGALVNDYKAVYSQLRSMGVPADKASEKAVERMRSTWGPSEAAGNQLMRLPPEHYNRPIEGAPNWMGEQLRDFVTATEGPARQKAVIPGKPGPPSRQRWEVSGLVSDGRTESEVSNGQPPSYQVVIKRAGGEFDVLPNRITFDGSKYLAQHEAELRTRQMGMEAVRAASGMVAP